MKHFLALVFCGWAALSAAQTPPPPEIAAASYLLLDMSSDQVLAERNAEMAVEPASLTKLMTAYIVFGALRDHRVALEQKLPVSQRAWAERKGGGSLMFLDPRMKPTVDELLHGLIVQSGNDAAVALAEGVAGSVERFVEMMNAQARAWGLGHTAFRNVTGMTEAGHRSSARDLATIATHAIRDFPEFYRYYGIAEYRFNNITQANRNLLLRRDPTVDGVKTGHTEAAGFCLVASAVREFPNGKRRLLSVVLNTGSSQARADESQKLLNWGFQAYDAVRLFEAGQAVVTPPVWKGSAAVARLGAVRAVYVSVPHGENARLQTRIERTDPLVAPLYQGQRVGMLKVSTASGTVVKELPLVVQQDVAEAGLIGRAWDAVRLWIR